jgi:hypothetical protein
MGRAINKPADSAESVDADFDCHVVFLLLLLFLYDKKYSNWNVSPLFPLKAATYLMFL